MIKTLIAAGALSAVALSTQAQEVQMSDTIYEIAIQEVKPGMEEAWAEQRAAFLEALSGREGNEKDWTFPAFFTFPEPGPNPVYVGITRWSQLANFAAASEALTPTDTAAAFFETVNMQAFVQARPLDGGDFVLEDYINTPGQVLEVAVRRPLEGQREAFDAGRDAIFGRVAEQPGYIFDREFVTADGWQTVLIGWDSVEAFQAALGVVSLGPEMQEFFGAAEIMAYQAARVE
ncbi:hypothetical protein K1W69_17205 [Hoeflea sp. WL0058]|uniref:Antibiotic biosynthesis monooxygenase n=1 Tax=Flavimaribacter sediminis TaxID=2865987 RepID=A0AAE2ZR69_9HYPH|nr:hypothetical protein [Flavimaribacter sediminis]MBW8638938.1 hypothetical protein [Flavimaribacter sediminis]